ncbi:hypothetical protein VW35_16460 [Devosia soli]|uniref:Uncharacterized protein n=1 Tax=Devosia soli TaxID=361041 RepID=A0A0F5L5J2_9HYPH|nr:hypothetical protein VW35_16460 [Devosia soli]
MARFFLGTEFTLCNNILAQGVCADGLPCPADGFSHLFIGVLCQMSFDFIKRGRYQLPQRNPASRCCGGKLLELSPDTITGLSGDIITCGLVPIRLSNNCLSEQ